jgi:hypothetical protein
LNSAVHYMHNFNAYMYAGVHIIHVFHVVYMYVTDIHSYMYHDS